MNKELAHELKTLVSNLPFVEVYAGMVQTVEYADPIDGQKEGARAGRKRMPVAYDTSIENCNNSFKENPLVPNSARKGILYFEDGGVSKIKKTAKGYEMQSTLVLVCWMNREKINGNKYDEISGKCMIAIFEKIVNDNPMNVGIFTRLKIKPNRILQQNKNVFSLYTYDETVNQYLRPPFEFFAIELICTYTVPSSCINQINVVETECGVQPSQCNDAGCPNGRMIDLYTNINNVVIEKAGSKQLFLELSAVYVNNSGGQPIEYRLIAGAGTQNPVTLPLNIGFNNVDLNALPVGEFRCTILSNYGSFTEFRIAIDANGEIVSHTQSIISDIVFNFDCEQAPNYPITHFYRINTESVSSLEMFLDAVSVAVIQPNGIDGAELQFENFIPSTHENNGAKVWVQSVSSNTTLEHRAIIKSKCLQ